MMIARQDIKTYVSTMISGRMNDQVLNIKIAGKLLMIECYKYFDDNVPVR